MDKIKISAPAAYWDEFNRLKWYQSQSVDSVIKTKSIYIDNDTDINVLKSLASNAICFTIEGDEILLTLNKTEEEIQAAIDEFWLDRQNGINYCKRTLRKWRDSSSEHRAKIDELCAYLNISID